MLVLYVCGEPDVTYMSDEDTPMLMYLNAHMAVNQIRTKNEAEGKIGAKVRSNPFARKWFYVTNCKFETDLLQRVDPQNLYASVLQNMIFFIDFFFNMIFLSMC